MNTKAVFSNIILAIIGGAIMVVLLMIMFSAISAPFLDYLAKAENIRSFNKFTIGLSTACTKGIDTQLNFGFSATSAESYVVSAVGSETSAYLAKSDNALTDRDSKSVIKKCKNSYCYCLFRGIIKEGYTLKQNTNVIVKEAPISDIENASYFKYPASASYNYGGVLSKMQEPAQTFTPYQSGTLQAVWIYAYVTKFVKVPVQTGNPQYPITYVDEEVPVDDAYNKDITVEIYKVDSKGYPDMNNFLGSSTITAESIRQTKSGWFRVAFSPLELDKTQKYAIVINSTKSLEGNAFHWNGSMTKGGAGEVSLGAEDVFFQSQTGWTKLSLIRAFDYAVEIQPRSIADNMKIWDSDLKSALEKDETNPFSSIRVLQCRTLDDDIQCKKDEQVTVMLPEIEKEGRYYAILWLQPEFRESGLNVLPLNFKSFTFERPIIAGGGYSIHLLSYTTPNLHNKMAEEVTGAAEIGEKIVAHLVP